VRGLAQIESHFEAFRGLQPLAPLIGRDDDLQILMRRWKCEKASEGHIILLSGEAAIGKSRLSAALLAELSREPHIRLRYFCSMVI
jgi:predicted ATPase